MKIVFNWNWNRRPQVGQNTLKIAAAALTVCVATTASAQDGDTAPSAEQNSERISQIETSMGALADEMDSLRKVFALPEDGPLLGYSGLGAGASKVYYREKGLSIGGYGEVRFRGQVADENGDQDVFDALRMVLYAGYKFNDWLDENGTPPEPGAGAPCLVLQVRVRARRVTQRISFFGIRAAFHFGLPVCPACWWHSCDETRMH